MHLLPILATTVALSLAISPAWAVQTTLTLQLGEDQLTSFERKVVHYTCTEGEPFYVDYINAAPNFLALVPIENAKLIFAGVTSTDGSKYVSSHWVWWNKGAEARLYDLTQGDKAEPLNTCTELTEIP